MASSAAKLQLAMPTANATASSSQCRSLSGTRPQRGRRMQGQFREAARTPSSRGPRSRSGTRCQRPSSEVELRCELSTFAAQDDCATGFVCDIMDDAIDDFADDLVHDMDSVYTNSPSASMSPMKAFSLPVNDAMLVMSSSEPCIEEVDEDEDICFAAALFTARSVEEAISTVAPGSPSWSLQVSAPSPVENTKKDTTASTLWPRQLDLDYDDRSNCEDYEEVYSLASEDSDTEETDDEMEAMAYVKMAVNLAKAAVSKGCAEQTEAAPKEQIGFDQWFFNAEYSPMAEKHTPYVPRLQNNATVGWSKVEIAQEEVNLDEAKAAARDALRNALLGVSVLHEETDAEEEEEEKDVEFLGEGPSGSDEIAFDFASNILDGAFMQAASTWAPEEPQEDEDDDLEELRFHAMSTLSKAAQTGQLESALRQSAQSQESTIEALKVRVRETLLKAAAQKESALENLKLKARESLLQASAQRDLVHKPSTAEMLREKAKATLVKAARTGLLLPALKTVSEQSQKEDIQKLRNKAKDTLAKAAHNGVLASTLKTVCEAANMKALKAKVRSTLFKAAQQGSLTSTLQLVAPQQTLEQKAEEAKAQQKKETEEELRSKLQLALMQGLQNGRLAQFFAAGIQNDEWEALRRKVRSTLEMGAATGKLQPAITEVLAVRQAADTPAPPAMATPSLAVEITEKLVMMPSTPTRTRRRVIGGVVRTPAVQLDLDPCPSASPVWSEFGSMSSKHHSKSSRKSKEGPKAFRLDLGDEEPTARTRASSITRGYDTLGAQFHSLSDSPSASSAPKMMLASERPSSKASARLRAASTSALALDLGLHDSTSSQAKAPSADNLLAALRQASFAPTALSLDRKMRTSASLGSLQTPKVSKARLLPSLASERNSAESIAWTMQMSKSTSNLKWCNAGLRGSASMIF